MKQRDYLTEWCEVLGLLAKYEFPDFAVTAEHDQIWFHIDYERLSVIDRKRLRAFGWTPDFENTAITRFV